MKSTIKKLIKNNIMATKKTTDTASVKGASAPEEIKLSASVNKKSDMPTMLPPDQNAFGGWNNNLKVIGTWGKAENTNAWLNISTLGFRKIKNTNAQAFLALLMIGTHARDKNSIVNVRTEADNKIYEMYVW